MKLLNGASQLFMLKIGDRGSGIHEASRYVYIRTDMEISAFFNLDTQKNVAVSFPTMY
jgi:hypothetical protein